MQFIGNELASYHNIAHKYFYLNFTYIDLFK